MAYGVDSAFVLGGTEDFLTTPETAAKLGGEVALPGLVQFNMTTKTFSNSSAAGYQTNGTAERGAMHYVPSFGPNGLYVVMGGDYIIPTDLRDFGTISIFDPLSKKWYQQATSGSIPKARVEFCTAGVNSTNGTYEMYVSRSPCFTPCLSSLGSRVTNEANLSLPQLHVCRVEWESRCRRNCI